MNVRLFINNEKEILSSKDGHVLNYPTMVKARIPMFS